MHAAEHDDIRAGPRRLLRQAERIADEIRHVLDFRHLVIVREDDGVELFFERVNFLGKRREAFARHGRAKLQLFRVNLFNVGNTCHKKKLPSEFRRVNPTVFGNQI